MQPRAQQHLVSASSSSSGSSLPRQITKYTPKAEAEERSWFSRMSGKFWGAYEEVADNGFFNFVLEEIKDLALNDPRGMCEFPIRGERYILVTDPKYIKQIGHQSQQAGLNRVLDKNYGLTLYGGKESVFARETDKPLPEGEVGPQAALKQIYKVELSHRDYGKMLEIAHEHIAKLTQQQGEIDLHASFTRIAIDMFVRNHMGCSSSLSDTRLTEVITGLADAAFNARNYVKQKLSLFSKTDIDKANREFEDILKECYLKKHDENSHDVISEIAKHLKVPITDKKMMTHIAFTLFMGQNAISKLLVFCLMIIGNDPALLKILRQECAAVSFNDAEGAENAIKKNLPTLHMVITECLRMFPPIPFSANKVSHPLVVGHIDHAKDLEHCKKLLEERNPENDFVFEPGVNIVICPYITGRLDKYFKDPEKFDYERKEYLGDDSVRGSFGFSKDRRCPGESEAYATVKMVIAMIVSAFDFAVTTELGAKTKLKYAGSLRLENAFAKFTMLPPKQEEKMDAVGSSVQPANTSTIRNTQGVGLRLSSAKK
jgi:cytochrome P450